jgi:hypothetical protein
LGIDARSDIAANVANLGLHLLLGEALVIGGRDQSISQLHHRFTASATDHLFVGVNTVREPEIYKLADICHLWASDQAGGITGISVIDERLDGTVIWIIWHVRPPTWWSTLLIFKEAPAKINLGHRLPQKEHIANQEQIVYIHFHRLAVCPPGESRP